MRQVVLAEPGRFVNTSVPPPNHSEGRALVRVHRVGVCGTDLHAFAGRQPFFSYPRVLGHELGVELLDVPAGGHGLKPGDRCAVEPYLACGRCHPCSLGKTNCCESLQVLGVHTDGGMCGLLSLPVGLLHKSDRLSFEQLALVETLGIGYHAVERSGLRPGESALIVGAGPIGLAVLQFALAAGGKVRVLDLSPERRRFAEQFGVETLATSDDRLAEVVIDATGNRASMEASFERAAFGGRLVFVGITRERVSFEGPHFHRRELTLLSSRNSAGAFPTIIRQIEEGKIDTSPWVTHRLGLAEVPERFPALPGSSGLVKAMVEVDETDVS